MSAEAFFTAVEDGVTIRLRATPRGPYDRIHGTHPDAEGRSVLKVTVTAPAEDGKANAAVVKLLAKAWKLPKSAFSVHLGATDRNKVLRVVGDPAELVRRLGRWMEDSHG
ncbi:MAG: DUF167 family protein [Magnetospirillum sp. WYHS-4]